MVDWQLVVLSGSIGVGVASIFKGIGWLFMRGERRRRDAAHIANIIYEDTKKGTEAEVDKEVGKLVTRYGRIFRKVKKQWKVKNKC